MESQPAQLKAGLSARVRAALLENWPLGLLIALSALLFRHHIAGTHTFLGNPDRLNNNLKILKHHVDSLAAGHLNAWSPYDLLGYDTFSLPYTFPNPLTWLTYWLGPGNFYVSVGFISAGLLASSGICAYLFVRGVVRTRAAALLAAVLYQFSALTVLKVSQNDMSFAVFIMIPLLMLLVRRIDPQRSAGSFVQLALALFVLLQFMFLQKAAYAVMLAGSFALYRSATRREWQSIAVFVAALGTATVLAFPRLYSLGIAMTQYIRRQPGQDTTTFDGVYAQQGVFPYQILRWLDGSIFGGHFSDQTAQVNHINLTEGFLLFTCSLVPFLLASAFVRYRSRWLGLITARQDDARFYLFAVLFTFAIVAWKPANHLMYLLFMKVDFFHPRILIIGLLPLVTLIALVWENLTPSTTAPEAAVKSETWIVWGVALLAAALAVVAIELCARNVQGVWKPLQYAGLSMSRAALVRIALSGAAVAALLLAIRFAPSGCLRTVSHAALLACLGMQTLMAANTQINSRFNLAAAHPFQNGDIYFAARDDFRPLDADAIKQLHQRVLPADFRSVMVCNPAVSGGFCAAHLGQSWQLRLADGYYGMGLPARIAELPWPNGAGLRHIAFTAREKLPWSLLGLLNVRYAIVANDAFYRNAPAAAGGNNIAGLDIIENPEPVTPRFFFAGAVRPTTSTKESIALLGSAGIAGKFVNVAHQSYAEGFGASRDFDTTGGISARDGGDVLTIDFSPSAQARFLVVNELYYPGWQAQVNGASTAIYPTNGVMRGMVVPPGATTLTLSYRSFTGSLSAKLFYLGGLALLVGGIWLFRRAATAGQSAARLNRAALGDGGPR
jgi:hypothetical protein